MAVLATAAVVVGVSLLVGAGSPGGGSSEPGAATGGSPSSDPGASGRALGTAASWGITIDPASPAGAQVAADTALVGRQVGIVNSFLAWDLPSSVQTALLDNLRTVSRTQDVMITWEPGGLKDAASASASQDGLAQIASGRADARIDDLLRQLDSFPGQVELRFAHEMNGSWYSWAGEPAAFTKAWARIHSRVIAVAPRVKMVWSVNNVDRPSSNTLERYWPGRELVDIIGLDGYNCLRGWETPSTVFARAYARVAALDPSLPIWITETSSCEAESSVAGSSGHSKAEWIRQLLATTSMPRVSAIVWFDRDKEFDWRVNSSPAATEALRVGLTR